MFALIPVKSLSLAKQRLADQPDTNAGRAGFDRSPQPGTAGTDNENVVFECCVISHLERGRPRPQTPLAA